MSVSERRKALLPPDAELLDAIHKALADHEEGTFHFLMVRAMRIGMERGYQNDISFPVEQRYHFAWYVAMRLNGTSHRLAEMLALQQTPFIMTDAVFLEGMRRAEQISAAYAPLAEEEGASVTGAFYHPGLASYPGDPSAFIRGRGDMMRVAEDKNLHLEAEGGRVIRQQREPEEAPDLTFRPSDMVVRQRVERMKAKNPDLEHADQTELYEQARDDAMPREPEVKDFELGD